MREILFRGKLADEGYWVEGGYIHLHKTTYCVAGEDDGSNDIHRIVFERMTDWNLPNRHLMGDVIPETVGQYTGLADKNGVKIFEGDILKGQYDEDSPEDIAILVVLWDNGWRIQQDDRVPDLLEEFDCQICEVIGNIHDNPELLKGGEEQ